MEKLLTIEDVAALGQISRETIQAHFEAGRLKGINIGIETPEWRFLPDDVKSFFVDLRAGSGKTTSLKEATAISQRIPISQVWRINLKPGRGFNSKNFCMAQGLVGVGWAVDREVDADLRTTLSWDEYQKRAAIYYPAGKWTTVIVLHDIPNKAVVWTRKGHGNDTRFFMGLITGPWEYRNDPNAMSADIVNVRPVLWHEVGGYNAVPDAIQRAFTPVTISRIKNHDAVAFTEGMAARLVSDGTWPKL